MTRYYEWDYNSMEVTEFKRKGKCLQCGQCCRARITFTFTKPARSGRACDGGGETNGEGIWQEVNRGRWRYFWKLGKIEPGATICEALTEEGLCEAHNEKSHLCAWWPMSPRCIAAFAGCGYSFEEVNHWKFDGIERDNRNKDKEIVCIREERDSAMSAAETACARLYTAIEQRDSAREMIDALLSNRPVVDDGETGVYCGYCQTMMGYCDPEDCVWERANQARGWIPSAGGSLRENSTE